MYNSMTPANQRVCLHAQQFVHRTPALTRLYLLQHFVVRKPHALKQRCILISRGIFDAFLGKGKADDQEWEGPIFEPIDPDSDGGLGGTSEELFGPLVLHESLKGFKKQRFVFKVIVLRALTLLLKNS